MSSPLIYQVHVRPWLHQLSREHRGRFTLADLPEEPLKEWSRHGFTHVWLMGVWTIGRQAREHALRLARAGRLPIQTVSDAEEGVCGSPYAIAGYRVDPELGGEESLAHFRRRLRAHGLGLILDFIPNHVALDHPWVAEHPGWFVGCRSRIPEAFHSGSGPRGRWIAHGKDPFFPAWSDTAQLDWRLQSVHEAMFRELERVAEQCDGIRADMAMLILRQVFEKQWQHLPVERGPCAIVDFWMHALAGIRARFPGFLSIAEAYWDLEAILLEQGFDYAYDKRFYDHLVARRPAEIRRHLAGAGQGLWRRGARFLENHDEARVAALASTAEHPSWAALLLGLPGLRLCHEGQFEGLRERADIRVLPRKTEPVDESIRSIYHSLLQASKALGHWRGEVEVLHPEPAWSGNPSHDAFVAWGGVRGEGKPLVVVANLANHEAQCRLRLANAVGADAIRWVDLLSGERFGGVLGSDGRAILELRFGAHQCAWLQPQVQA